MLINFVFPENECVLASIILLEIRLMQIRKQTFEEEENDGDRIVFILYSFRGFHVHILSKTY